LDGGRARATSTTRKPVGEAARERASAKPIARRSEQAIERTMIDWILMFVVTQA
jgi:hypothetical protein